VRQAKGSVTVWSVTISRVPILWLHGADAVGKSTVAWEIYDVLREAGSPIAYLDTDNLGFCTPAFDDSSRLVELNIASMWPNFEAAGARCLVVAGIIVTLEQRRRFEASIPDGELTLCRLRAKPETLAARILRRGQIEGAGTDGAVSALTLQTLTEYGERAVGFAARLDADDIADFAVDTDDVAVPSIAKSVLDRAGGWPGGLADGSA
jgi:adenylylsulfate kinase